MKRYKKKLSEQLNQLDNEQIEDLISQLKDGKFSNISDRIEFIKVILPLALSTDKRARKIIKAMGDLMTTLGDQMLSDDNDIDSDFIEDEIIEDDIVYYEKHFKEANRDGTGPEGKGPLTGRGEGDCSDEDKEEDDDKKEKQKEKIIDEKVSRKAYRARFKKK